MNQILSMQSNMDDKNNNNTNNIKNQRQAKNYKQYNNKANINSILRVFSIFIILFGLALIGNSVYAIMTSTPEQKDTLNITTENVGAEAIIRVTGQRPIQKLTYRWGQESEEVVNGDGTVQLEVTLQIPTGNNILNMTVTDYYGNTQDFQKQYINESDDQEKPSIQIPTQRGNLLNVVVTDNSEIAYITYKWDDGEETRIDMDANQEDKKRLETSIEVTKEGESILTITAVDNDGNRQTYTTPVIGSNKPTFTVNTDGNTLIVNAKDNQGLSKISITVDGETQEADATSLKEVEATTELEPGTHTITIIVTNINGLSTEQSYTATL